jgi:hypothetical protein
MEHFYNNLNIERGELLRQLETMCKTQDAQVLKIYESAPTIDISRWNLQELYNSMFPSAPISDMSLGRALCTLSKTKQLIVTGQEQGRRGAPNYNYRYNPNQPTEIIAIPKELRVSIEWIELEDGTYDIDMEGMIQTFIKKVDDFDYKYNKK